MARFDVAPAVPANTESDDSGPSGASTGSELERRRPAELVRIEVPFPTEESLAQQDEQTNELRRAIDELRQMLDVDAVPPMPAPTRRRRRRAPLLLLLLVAAALVAAGGIAIATGGSDDDGTAAPRSPASTPAAPSAGATSTVSSAGPPQPAPLAPAPGTAPVSGPGVTLPGTLLVVSVSGDRTMHVTEQAILADESSSQVPLVLPDVQRLGGDIAGLTPRVSQVRAALDGTPAAIRAAGPGRWFIPVDGEVRRVQVSYVVTDAVLTSRPSETGRALGLVQPLLGAGLATGDLPLIVRTTGTKVVGSSCPDAPAALQLCGTGDGKGNWTATVPSSANPVVVLQVDLPG